MIGQVTDDTEKLDGCERSLDLSGRVKGPMGSRVEAGAQCVCDHLKRPDQPTGN